MSGSSLQHHQTASDQDARFLQDALDLAARIPRRPWPNPPVGAVVVHEGEVVGRGAHQGAGEAHAERIALAEAGPRARGATLYCTLEPCRHHGRTPPCTEAVLAAGIARVVIGIRDLNPPAGGGADQLHRAGLDVSVGVLGERCLELVWPFVASEAFARPYVELKTATSLDGRFGGVADPAGRPTYLTGEEARRQVHERRRWHDLVLVGAGTARHDRPRLDTRLVTAGAACPQAEPLAGCVTDGNWEAEPARLDRAQWLCFHPQDRPPDPSHLPAGAEPIACPAAAGGVDPAGLLTVCQERGLQAIYLEGGPHLAAAFLSAGLVDRWVQYTSPLVLGGGATWPAAFAQDAASGAFTLTRCGRVGDDLCAVWDRRDFTATLNEAMRTQEVS